MKRILSKLSIPSYVDTEPPKRSYLISILQYTKPETTVQDPGPNAGQYFTSGYMLYCKEHTVSTAAFCMWTDDQVAAHMALVKTIRSLGDKSIHHQICHTEDIKLTYNVYTFNSLVPQSTSRHWYC